MIRPPEGCEVLNDAEGTDDAEFVKYVLQPAGRSSSACCLG